LPNKQYTYIFQEVIVSHNSECGLFCSTTILINVTTQDRAIQWIHDFEEQTKTTFRITRGVKVTGKKVIYKTIRHCQHKRKHSNKPLKKKQGTLRDKKTECPSQFTLKVYNQHTTTVSKHATHPCEINLFWGHNHATSCAKALSFRPVNENTINLMQAYFKQGHSPSSALHLHHLNLATEYSGRDGRLDLALADRSLNPMYNDVYYIYKKWRMEQHGEPNGEKCFKNWRS